MSEPKVTGLAACLACAGYGTIWVNWNPKPVQCGHCHGTGESCATKDDGSLEAPA